MLGRIAIWVLIAFVLFTVFRQFDGERAVPAAEQTSYTQFMADAKAGRISRVDVQGRKLTVTPTDGPAYSITSPGDAFCKLVPDAAFDRRVDFLHASDAGRQGRRLLLR